MFSTSHIYCLLDDRNKHPDTNNKLSHYSFFTTQHSFDTTCRHNSDFIHHSNCTSHDYQELFNSIDVYLNIDLLSDINLFTGLYLSGNFKVLTDIDLFTDIQLYIDINPFSDSKHVSNLIFRCTDRNQDDSHF